VVTWVAVGALGGLGSLLRVVLATHVQHRAASLFPWGTFAVNVSGSALLGVLDGAGVHGDALLLAGTATLGAYTTFSTLVLEAERLGEERHANVMWAYLAASLAAGLTAAALGRWAGGFI
jgi:CrcB protein